MAATLTLSRFQPLKHVLCFDDFDRGTCGWMDLCPNFTQPNWDPRPSGVDKNNWGPAMLSTASFPWVGTHGSMDGLYSLKLCTRPFANRYEDRPASGSMSQVVKRMSRHRPFEHIQLEAWYAYTPEQDRHGLGEKDIRAFGFFLDLQDDEKRFFPGVRYLNSVNGELKRRWQYSCAADVTDQEWAHGFDNDWCKRGIDPQWYGRRYPDGRCDAWPDLPGGEQELLYNESDDKINWLYVRLLANVRTRSFVELQSMDQTFDMAALKPSAVAPYRAIRNLINPSFWVENDTNRRVFLFLDSMLISVE